MARAKAGWVAAASIAGCFAFVVGCGSDDETGNGPSSDAGPDAASDVREASAEAGDGAEARDGDGATADHVDAAESAVDVAADIAADSATDTSIDVANDIRAADGCSGQACGEVAIVVNVCPMIDVIIGSPSHAPVGEDVEVQATGIDSNGDTISFAWTATAGSFVNPNAAKTKYHCATPGTQMVTVTVSDGVCGSSGTIPVLCDPQ